MSPLHGNLRLICHQLRSPENLGALARVMANFGLDQLILSEPVTHRFLEAEKLAVGAEHVLSQVAVAKTLPEALSSVTYACGTSSRVDIKGREVLTPEVAMARLAEAARRGPVALVLGGEKRGLSDDELSFCHDITRIPTRDPQPSMNVSHAAAVLLYLASVERASVERASVEQSAGAPQPPSVRLETLQALEGKLQALLERAGFLNPQAPQRALRELMRSLERVQLSQREAEMWTSVAQHLSRMD